MNNNKRVNLTHRNLIASDALAKAKKCKKYQEKYQAIQAKQRQANTNKQSNKLKEKANKSFKQWQRCKQGKRG